MVVYPCAAAITAGITSHRGKAPFSIAAFATSSVHIHFTFKAGCEIVFIPAGGTASDGLPSTPAYEPASTAPWTTPSAVAVSFTGSNGRPATITVAAPL